MLVGMFLPPPLALYTIKLSYPVYSLLFTRLGFLRNTLRTVSFLSSKCYIRDRPTDVMSALEQSFRFVFVFTSLLAIKEIVIATKLRPRDVLKVVKSLLF